MTRRRLTPTERAKRARQRTASRRRWIEPQDFQSLRRHSGLTRHAAAVALDVTARTIQNWETGGARIPWMAFRMLRILQGYALPGKDWEGWTVRGRELISPTGYSFDAYYLDQVQWVFAEARLWRQDRAYRFQKKTARILPFPDRRTLPPKVQLFVVGGQS